MRWAFEQMAEGVYTTLDVWKMAKERGLSCAVNSFRTAMRNVGYCGKVLVSKYKNEEAHLVQGQHEALISEALFYKVQDVLDGRKRDIGVNSTRGINIVSLEMLPLRGFLQCDRCPRMITGSASKGRHGNYHHYYHCRSSCGWRGKAETVNMAFVDKLWEFIPKPGVPELFKEIVCDLYSDDSRFQQSERKKIIAEITDNNNRITKARELLLNDSISPEDYKFIKTEAEEKIIRLEAKLKDFNDKGSAVVDIEGLVYKAVETLKKLDLRYVGADVKVKEKLLVRSFPKNGFFRMENIEPEKSIKRPCLSIRLTVTYVTKKPD